MDGEWQQQNGNVHDELNLSIPIDDKDEFWNNLAIIDDEDDDDAHATDEDYTGAASSSKKRRRRTVSRNAKRHSTEQIQQLEAVFLECPHPDENLRFDLAKKLGMDVMQIKFWFQNRRSAKKNQLEKQENLMLRGENEALKAEHQALKAALLKKDCPTCGGPMVPRDETSEQQNLFLENESLKDRLIHANAVLKNVAAAAGKAPMPMPGMGGYSQLAAATGSGLVMDPAVPPPPPHHALRDNMVQGCVRGSCAAARANEQRIDLLGRALRARDEFMMLVKKDDTMWLPTLDGEVLDYPRYHEVTYPGILGFCPMGFGANGTRDTGMVMGTGTDLVQIFTEASRWCEAFPGIVATATGNNIVPPTAHHGVVQLMNVNLMVLSPRMPLCKVKFVRQCQQIQPNIWAVVDVSVNDLHGPDGRPDTHTWINGGVLMACRMLPSGCLIEDLKNGYCKVTWIVNAEFDKTMVPGLYQPLLRSGHALGARRWLTSLQMRRQNLAVLRSDPARYAGKTPSAIPPEGTNIVLKLAQQMTAWFCATICGAGPKGQPWSSVEECAIANDSFELGVRVATVRTGGGAPGAKVGLVISAATTVWLPGIPAKHVFDYIYDGDRRYEWDNFSNGAPVQHEDYVAAVQFPHYAVSVLHPKAATATINKKLILQQVCSDASCMLLAYAAVEEQELKEVMRGGSQSAIYLLPSGFVILPDGHGDDQMPPIDSKSYSGAGTSQRTNKGSLVTVLFQRFLGGPPPSENLTAQITNNVAGLVSRSIVKIKDAVHANFVATA
ncbi:unnamed protein product [Alopecurus aequalis]